MTMRKLKNKYICVLAVIILTNFFAIGSPIKLGEATINSLTTPASEINYLLLFIYSRFMRYTSTPIKTTKIIANDPAKPFISNKFL